VERISARALILNNFELLLKLLFLNFRLETELNLKINVAGNNLDYPMKLSASLFHFRRDSPTKNCRRS
jgi:hypothetical protein